MKAIDSKRFQRLRAGIAANGFTTGVVVLTRLGEVTVLLGTWGASKYGEWLMIAALPTAISLSDGGFTRTARREMGLAYAGGRTLEASQIFQSAWLMLLMLSIGVMIAVGAAVQFINFGDLLHLKSSSNAEVASALAFLALQALVYFQCSLIHGSLSAVGRYAFAETLMAGAALLSFLGLALCAWLFKGFGEAALGALGGCLLGLLFMLFGFARIKEKPDYGFCKEALAHIKRLIVPSLANMVFPISDALNVHGTRLVLGLFAGPLAVSIFSTTRTLCRVALTPVMSVARTIEPEMSLAYGAGADEQVRVIFARGTQFALWLSLVLASIVVVAAPLAYPLWSGGRLELDSISLSMLILASIVNVVWGVALTVPCSRNRHLGLSLKFLLLYGLGSVAATGWLAAVDLEARAGALAVLLVDVACAVLVVRCALVQSKLGLRDLLKLASVPPLIGRAKAS